jgi:polysaccharide biosynthesis protein PslG
MPNMKHKHVLGNYLSKKQVVIGLVVLLFAAGGFVALQNSSAASFATAVEAEVGTRSGSVSLVSDGSASGAGDNVVHFGSTGNSQPSPMGLAEGGLLQHMSATDLNTTLDGYKNLGVRWVRTDIDWLRVQAGGANSFDWSAYDQVIDAIKAHGMDVVGILAYPPGWAQPSGCSDAYSCPPNNPADFGRYGQAAAARYAPKGVHVWEIWNEPNGGTFTPAQYTATMKAAYPAIKAGDPNAVVLAGGSMPNDTSGSGYSPVDFLQGIYVNGGKNYFDALTHHPYCWGGGTSFDCPKAYADWSAWSQMQETSPSLRSVMTANGDSAKKIWMTEMGAPTKGSAGNVSEQRQAQMVTDSYAEIKKFSWAGPLFWYQYKDKGTDPSTNSEDWFGLLHEDGSQKPAYTAYKTAATP